LALSPFPLVILFIIHTIDTINTLAIIVPVMGKGSLGVMFQKFGIERKVPLGRRKVFFDEKENKKSFPEVRNYSGFQEKIL
jgi:hypothetical protein